MKIIFVIKNNKKIIIILKNIKLNGKILYKTIGELNKKLIIPFLLAVVQIIHSTFEALYPEKGKNSVLEFYIISLSNMAVVFIPKIKFFSPSNIKEKKNCKFNKKIL